MKLTRLLPAVLLSGSILLTSACDGFLDVNTDPTAPVHVSENLQLSSLLGKFSYEVVASDPARITNLWTQQIAWSGTPSTGDNYDVDESIINNLWNNTYIHVLNNARELEELAEDNGNSTYAGMAKVIQAWAFSILTDLWDEIPYSEALDAVNSTPAYDSQEVIYSGIIGLLEDALADFAQDHPMKPSEHDLLYGGNIDLWERMTNTLLARLHLRLSNAPGYDSAAQAQLALTALSDGFMSNNDDADFQYYDVAGEENPWYQFAIDGKWPNRNQLSAHYVDLLNDLDDPRLPIQARPAGAVNSSGIVPGFDPEEPEYIGHQNGEEGPGTSSVSSIGAYYSDAGAPLNWISYAESKFIEAEATFILNGAAAAQVVYEDAIRASMEKLGVPGDEITDYISSLSLLEMSGNPLNEIITQKYIANFLSPEVFNDWRRTGYPELDPVTNMPKTPSGTIPVRFPYPGSELSNNEANVSATGIPVGYEALEILVWWDSGN